MFNELHNEFEKKSSNLHILQQKEGFDKYILIRSLDIPSLKAIIKDKTGLETTFTKYEELYEELFNIDISIDELIRHINTFYPDIRNKRIEEESHLALIIQNLGTVKCGIRNDNMNDVAKELVRDKSIESKEMLDNKIDELLNGTIKGYIYWQYYNQVTNDLIEHLFNDNIKVIPTLRKIHDVDFFIKIENKIVPFDLKITHISNDFFGLYSKGLEKRENCDGNYKVEENDDYGIKKDGLNETEIIKELYSEIKQKFELPSLSKKQDLISKLLELTGNDYSLENLTELKKIYSQYKEERRFPNFKELDNDNQKIINLCKEYDGELTNNTIANILNKRRECLEELNSNRKNLEWWNYKFQGERLFKNNNRFFIFLAYNDSFEDARPLKGDIENLKEIVNSKLNSITSLDNLNQINYYYTKERTLKGEYRIMSTSVIYTKNLNMP
ncbi:hypothetical protein [Aliarcobacter cryaerophilus]|uniref:hypothetical protein n=1 Tax=Aliarcobacter cryaerophilus TaxID=28198 RepID=UPI0021B1665F|nr:hypothetical protein [Aliarcobacter cryaerophilus]MCT7482803.1 hypothetical protein [Aliarcobacter cryaerophilus]